MNGLKHVLTAKDFSFIQMLELFRTTATMKTMYQNPAHRAALRHLLVRDGVPLFFRILSDPSTRTLASFEDAIRALGGTFSTGILEFSSKAKGETHRSIARCIAPRCDGIIIRDDHDEYAAQHMRDTVEDYGLATSIICAGSGDREHPTQMLIDLFTIWERAEEKFVNGALVYALVGDLHSSRTIHSLLLGISEFGGVIFLVGPPEENIPPWIYQEIEKRRPLSISRVINPMEIADMIDFWYFTRLQDNLKFRAVSPQEKQHYAQKYGVEDTLRARMRNNAWILHPLPHGEEYPEKIDMIDPRFIHFHQADNGFFMRMALLKKIFVPSADLTLLAADTETITISGNLIDFEVIARDVNTICINPLCLNIRINGNWIHTNQNTKLRLQKRKPATICMSCYPG